MNPTDEAEILGLLGGPGERLAAELSSRSRTGRPPSEDTPPTSVTGIPVTGIDSTEEKTMTKVEAEIAAKHLARADRGYAYAIQTSETTWIVRQNKPLLRGSGRVIEVREDGLTYCA